MRLVLYAGHLAHSVQEFVPPQAANAACDRLAIDP
jgi:hypothetical protein